MMVHDTTSLAYPQDHMLALRPICILHMVMMSSNVTDVWQCNLCYSNPNPKLKIET